MSIEIESVKMLLRSARNISDHQQEIQKLRGETFNVFSILKIEAYENGTHSAFLGELLNPEGSHMCGATFLKLFLQIVGYKGKLDVETANVVLEKFIGSRDDKLKVGGRIDIYVVDQAGFSISIENKIYAGDQYAQIERYVNHNKDKNKVYYLTLQGGASSEGSSGELREEHDYNSISYKSTVLQWLDKCLKESAEHAILRESIRQYIFLIKKLTNQLTDSKMEKAIESLIRSNYAAAKVLASNIYKLEVSATYDLLLEIKSLIDEELKAPWEISLDDDLTQSWTGLHITHKDWNGIEVKLEGYSKMPWGNNYYGIAATEARYDRSILIKRCAEVSILRSGFIQSKHWPYYRYVLDFSTDEKRAILFDQAKKSAAAREVANKLIDLAKACEQPLARIETLEK